MEIRLCLEEAFKTWKFVRLTTSANHHAASSPTAEETKVEEMEREAVEEEEKIAMEETFRRMTKKMLMTAMVSMQKLIKAKVSAQIKMVLVEKEDSTAAEVVETKFTSATERKVNKIKSGRLLKT